MSNNNPIENAKKAVSANDEATLKEEATLLFADWYIKKNLDGENVGKANDYVKNNLQGNYSEDLKSRLSVSDTGVITIEEEKTLTEEEMIKAAAQKAYEDWLAKKEAGESTGVIVEEYVQQTLKDQNYSDELVSRVEISDSGAVTVATVTIPNGFEYLEGTVSTGYVIKNSTDNNEFVWVPVEEGTFVREAGYEDSSLQSWNTTEYVEPYEATDYTSEKAEYDAMVASVSKYEGFYIARYEASCNGSNVAQSLPNKIPWNNIACGISMTDVTGGAVEAARAVYPVSSATTGEAVSTLPYGVQWDATVRFLETKYPDIAADSTGYGNYDTGDIINTGSNPTYALNNIYDIAGNVFEWTMETYSSANRVYRGGETNVTGSYNPVSYREWDVPGHVSDYLGFRLAIYIK